MFWFLGTLQARDKGAGYLLTVFTVHLLDFPQIGAILDNVIVEFVPGADGSQLGTRKQAEWMKAEIVHDFQSVVGYDQDRKGPGGIVERHLRAKQEPRSCVLTTI